MRKFLTIALFLGLSCAVFANNPIGNGDVNGNGYSVSDVVYLSAYIFQSGPDPIPIETIPEVNNETRGCDFDGRFVRTEPVTDEFIITDGCTALVWGELTGTDFGPHAFGDLQDEVDDRNTDEFGGFDDWRVPTAPELYSLLSIDNATEPAIDDDAFVELTDQLDVATDISEEILGSRTSAVDIDSTTTEDESDRVQSFAWRSGSMAPFLSDDVMLILVRGGQ